MAGRKEKGAEFPMPIRAVPYRHQMEAFRFACGLFGILPEGMRKAGSRDKPSGQPDTPEEWLDGFGTFSIYQVLPKLIELWGLNVKTDAEAKKTSPNRPANDNAAVPA